MARGCRCINKPSLASTLHRVCYLYRQGHAYVIFYGFSERLCILAVLTATLYFVLFCRFLAFCRFWLVFVFYAVVGTLCVCVCVFSSHSFWKSSSLDVPAGVTQEEGHTGFLIHLLSAVRALIFLARRIQPFLSLVDREVEFCVLTILIVLHPLGIFL